MDTFTKIHDALEDANPSESIFDKGNERLARALSDYIDETYRLGDQGIDAIAGILRQAAS